MTWKRTRGPAALAGALAALVAAPLQAAGEDAAALRAELEQLRQEVRELRAMVSERGKEAATKQEVRSALAQVKSEIAASDPATRNSIAHVAGYGDVGYASARDGVRGFNRATFNPIFHFQYKDVLFFETELETALEDDGGTEIGLEYANFNYFASDAVTIFAGKFLSPVGFFVQNLHPSWINRFASAPPGFGHGGAAPTSALGAGARGGLGLGSMKATYALFVANAPRLELNAGGDEIEMIEAEGSTRNPSRSPMLGGRLGLIAAPGLEFGLSAAGARVAVEPPAGGIEPKRSYRAAGADFALRAKGFELRGEHIQQQLGDLASSVAPEGGKWRAWYLQAAYRVPGSGWEPVLRYGEFRSPHPDQRQKQWGLGLNYWIAANAVAKLGFESNRGLAGTANDRDRVLVQFAYGF